MNKMGKKTQSCPTREPSALSKPNLVYTDLKGLQQLKRVVKAGIGQYRFVWRAAACLFGFCVWGSGKVGIKKSDMNINM